MTSENATSQSIGFIGLGRMGQGMARNLAKGGGGPLVYDPVQDAVHAAVKNGCRPAASVAEVALASSVIFLSLPGPQQVEEVVLGTDGILANMRPGLVLFDLSTNSRVLALQIEAALREKGGHMLDAPVSGGPAGAATGNLVLWIGGERAVFDAHVPLLSRFSTPHYVGLIGAGTVTKLAHNMLGYAVMEAQAEAFSLAVKAGLDPMDFWQALRLGIVGKQSPLMMLVQQFLPNDYDKPAFALRLALKDVRLAGEMADELGVPMRLSALAREDMEAAVARGQGDEDSRSFLKLQLERAGVRIEVAKERIERAINATTA